MKIIVTDGYVENPGDLSWAPLEALGEVTYYDRIGLTDEDETIRRIGDAEIAVINKAPVTRKVIDSCPNLKLITVLATGYNVVDVAYAKEKGIPVCNVPNYGGYSVSQFTIALMLEACLHIGHHNQTVHDGKWQNGNEWCYWDYPLIELAGKTYGLLGCGKRVLKVGGDARDIFFGFTQGICRVGNLHRELAGAHRIVGGICRGIALQLGILMTQRLELGARGVDGLLCGGNAGVSLCLHLVADALGIFESTNQAVAGLARARLAGFHGVECSLQAEFGRIVLCLHLLELALELRRFGGMDITVNFSCCSGLLCRGDCLALVGDDLIVAACDVLARLELLCLVGDTLRKLGQVGAGIGECLLCGVHLAHGRRALGDKSAHGVSGV